MLIKNKSPRNVRIFLRKHLFKKKKDSVFLNVTPFVDYLYILTSSLPFTGFFSFFPLYSFPLMNFVTLDMCFYLVINSKEFIIIIIIIIITIFTIIVCIIFFMTI